MNLYRFIKSSIFILLLKVNCTAYAHDDQNYDIIERLLKHAGSSIEKIEDNRIVFRSERTCLYEGVIYVEGENGEVVDLSPVHQHLFYEGSSLSFWTQPKDKKILYVCPKCSWAVELSSQQNAPLECIRCHHAPLLIRYR